MQSERPLVLTKLYKPRAIGTWVVRPRLARALDEGLSRKLILVDAPAGYGKTTLLAQWLCAQSLGSAWLSLDEADNDLGLFLSYLYQAVRTLHPDCMPITAMLLSAAQLPPVDDLASTLINELDALPDEIILVLDDFHVIQSSEIAQLMSRLVAHPPSSVHLVLMTRSDPRLPLAKLRARSEILEIRATDLRFSPDEARAFLHNEVQYPLDERATQLLEGRTEGWPAGLRLVALSLNTLADPQSFIEAFTSSGNAHVTSFLVNEVLANLTVQMQDFLLRASLLDRFCAPLCDSLRGADHDSVALLDEIGRQNLFLIPLDSNGDWFRFHHLFRDLLRSHVQVHLSADAIADLHCRASDWLAAHGLHEEALQHALAASNMNRVIRLVEDNALDIFNREEWVTLSRWLAYVPREIVQRRPRLLLAHAYMKFLRDEWTEMLPWLNQAERLLRNGDGCLDWFPDEIEEALGHVLTMRSHALVGEELGGVEMSEKALSLLPETHTYARGLAFISLSLGMQTKGRRLEAEERLRLAAAQTSSHDAFSIRILFASWVMTWYAGEIGLAAALTERYLAAAEASGLMLSTCWAHTFAGLRYHEINDLDRAIEHFEVVVAHAHQANFRCQVMARIQLALAQQAAGRPALADAALHAARAHAQATQVFIHWQRFDALEAQLQFLRGDIASAMRWVQSSAPDTGADAVALPDLPNMTRAQILIAQRSPDGLDVALALLQALHDTAQSWHYHYPRAMILAVKASALWVLDWRDEALHIMAEAAEIGQRGGLVRTFADLGPDVLTVLRALAESPAPDNGSDCLRCDYLTRVIAAFAPSSAITVDGVSAEQVSLTLREIEVLELLDRRRSDKEIAEALILSRFTVANHTANIYRKLGVSNRREAVFKARALGIFSRDA